ncbi:hypothetical protein ACFL0J_07275 [Candidatus Neomarinimicrobiota bacterium]
MVKVTATTVKETRKQNRICSNCGHQWVVSYQFKATESTFIGSPDFSKKRKKEDSFNEDKGVLCPKCSHFSKNVMEKRFKDGYAKGIKYMYKISLGLWGCGMLVFLWFPAIALFNHYPFRAFLIILFTIAMFFFAKLIIKIFYIRKLNEILSNTSEIVLFQLLSDSYRKEKSFSAGDIVKRLNAL